MSALLPAANNDRQAPFGGKSAAKVSRTHHAQQSAAELPDLSDQHVVEEASRRIFRGRLNPLLRAHGYESPKALYGEVWEKACAMNAKYDQTKGTTPAAYLAAGAARALKKRLCAVSRGIRVPLSRKGESADTQVLKQAARCVVSIDGTPGGHDSLPGVDAEEVEGLDVFAVLAAENFDTVDEVRDDEQSTVFIEAEEQVEMERNFVDSSRLALAMVVDAWAHCGDVVLEALADEFAKLESSDAWARAVSAAALRLGLSPTAVRAVVLDTVRAAALAGGNTRREAERRVTEMDVLLRRAGKRGPYKRRDDRCSARKPCNCGESAGQQAP